MSTGTAYAANTIFSADIVDGEVRTPDVHSSAVSSTKIKDGDIAGVDIANEAITAAQIATDGVNASEIADNSIDGGEIVDNSLTAADLATASVTSLEIAGNAVGTAQVASNSLTTADIKGTDLNGGQINLGAGSVANGTCKDFSISASGAAVGEAVVISTQASLPEGTMIYGVRVPSADTVTMKVCNLSGGSMPAISNLPIRVITFG